MVLKASANFESCAPYAGSINGTNFIGRRKPAERKGSDSWVGVITYKLMSKMKLTRKQRDQLWGEGGPYSEARLSIETRILDDSVSRVFVVVEVSINPLTFEIISKNRKHFKDDEMILQLIDHADDRGQYFGHVAQSFMHEYTDEDVLKDGQKALDYSKETIINMHQFVMDLLNIKPSNRYYNP